MSNENIPEIMPRLPEHEIEEGKKPSLEDIEGGLRIWKDEERKRNEKPKDDDKPIVYH